LIEKGAACSEMTKRYKVFGEGFLLWLIKKQAVVQETVATAPDSGVV
jgi:hypothetical protein